MTDGKTCNGDLERKDRQKSQAWKLKLETSFEEELGEENE